MNTTKLAGYAFWLTGLIIFAFDAEHAMGVTAIVVGVILLIVGAVEERISGDR